MTARLDDVLFRWGLHLLDGGGSLFPPSNGSGTDSQNYTYITASNTTSENLIETDNTSTTSNDYSYPHAGLDYMARPVRQSVTSDELIAHALQEELTTLAAAEETRTPRLSVTSDELIAHALQGELTSLAAAEEAAGSSGGSVVEGSKSTVLNQDWTGKRSSDKVDCSAGATVRGTGEHGYGASGLSQAGVVEDSGLSSRFRNLVTEGENTMGPRAHASSSSSERRDRPRSPDYELYQHGDDDDLNLSLALALSEEEQLVDEEVAKRLNKLDSIKHIPRVNTDFPTLDAASMDHQRLAERLVLYGLSERQIQGDGNCQFRALSDQLYRTSEHHKYVRKAVVNQLKSRPEVYSGYVPMSYSEYLKKMSKSGEWGDHVTLQAAADYYGTKIWLITSFKDTAFIEILPAQLQTGRVIYLSFWSEIHYNSIYPEGVDVSYIFTVDALRRNAFDLLPHEPLPDLNKSDLAQIIWKQVKMTGESNFLKHLSCISAEYVRRAAEKVSQLAVSLLKAHLASAAASPVPSFYSQVCSFRMLWRDSVYVWTRRSRKYHCQQLTLPLRPEKLDADIPASAAFGYSESCRYFQFAVLNLPSCRLFVLQSGLRLIWVAVKICAMLFSL